MEASETLTKLVEKVPELDKITLLRTEKVDGEYVLLLGSGDLARLRSDPSTIELISSSFESKTWMIEGETSTRKILEDLFHPIKILTVNVVWLPDGSKLTKVIIPRRATHRIPIDIEKVKRIVKAVKGIDLLVEFERR